MTFGTQRLGRPAKLNVESNCSQKNGENCSFRSERTAYRHNLANPAQIWFESRAAATDLANSRLDVDQGQFLVPFLRPRCRIIKPNAQYRAPEEKKTEVSGVVYSF